MEGMVDEKKEFFLFLFYPIQGPAHAPQAGTGDSIRFRPGITAKYSKRHTSFYSMLVSFRFHSPKILVSPYLHKDSNHRILHHPHLDSHHSGTRYYPPFFSFPSPDKNENVGKRKTCDLLYNSFFASGQ